MPDSLSGFWIKLSLNLGSRSWYATTLRKLDGYFLHFYLMQETSIKSILSPLKPCGLTDHGATICIKSGYSKFNMPQWIAKMNIHLSKFKYNHSIRQKENRVCSRYGSTRSNSRKYHKARLMHNVTSQALVRWNGQRRRRQWWWWTRRWAWSCWWRLTCHLLDSWMAQPGHLVTWTRGPIQGLGRRWGRWRRGVGIEVSGDSVVLVLWGRHDVQRVFRWWWWWCARRCGRELRVRMTVGRIGHRQSWSRVISEWVHVWGVLEDL